MLKMYPNPNEHTPLPELGIHAISSWKPDLILPNSWYEQIMAKKFVKHTGIRARAVSSLDETALAERAVRKIVKEKRLDLGRCAGIVLVIPSVIPQSVARQHLTKELAREEQPNRIAVRLANRLGIRPRFLLGMNGFCSGYAKAMHSILEKGLPTHGMLPDEYYLLVTSNRISRITDFEDRQAGALFGDFATASAISRTDSQTLPAPLRILDSRYEKKPAQRAYFSFRRKQNVLLPTPEGGRTRAAERLVFSLDGMGIADTAPRAMADAAAKMVAAHGIAPSAVRHLIPHQAGEAIVRLTGMKLEEAGFQVPPVNGLTAQTGNISSGSVPFALQQNWSQLDGLVLCPVAAVGSPGKPEVSQGCLFLEARHSAIRPGSRDSKAAA